MNCIVVDDNKMARTAIKELIAQVDFLTFVKEYSNPVEAYNFLKKEPIDLVFLDVEMPGMTGIELIKSMVFHPLVILITAKKEYAIEAFELNVADYIIKPIKLSRFMIAVSRAKELFDSKDQKVEINDIEKDYIFVRSDSILTKIKIDEISYVQAMGDYVNIFSADKRHTVHITLKKMEEKLPATLFYRLHRSYLIAVNKIDNVEGNSAYIGKHPIPIGEQFKKDLLNKINLI